MSEPTILSKGEVTRRAILDAAIARFGRDGFRATSVADIARDATVSGTVPYRYFADKEALFFAALDEDASAAIGGAMSGALEQLDFAAWRRTLTVTLVGAVEHHPLARRLLAGLEPEVTPRVLDIPALNELRRVFAERIHTEQAAGRARGDVDPTSAANGIVAILMSLLMSIVQLGPSAAAPYADDIAAFFEAALTEPGRAGRAAAPDD